MLWSLIGHVTGIVNTRTRSWFPLVGVIWRLRLRYVIIPRFDSSIGL